MNAPMAFVMGAFIVGGLIVMRDPVREPTWYSVAIPMVLGGVLGVVILAIVYAAHG